MLKGGSQLLPSSIKVSNSMACWWENGLRFVKYDCPLLLLSPQARGIRVFRPRASVFREVKSYYAINNVKRHAICMCLILIIREMAFVRLVFPDFNNWLFLKYTVNIRLSHELNFKLRLSLYWQPWWILRLQKREWALGGKSTLFLFVSHFFSTTRQNISGYTGIWGCASYQLMVAHLQIGSWSISSLQWAQC